MNEERNLRVPIGERYRRIAERPFPEVERKKLGLWKGATWGDAIALQLFKFTLRGNVVAAREIREGIDGKPTLESPTFTRIYNSHNMEELVRRLFCEDPPKGPGSVTTVERATDGPATSLNALDMTRASDPDASSRA